MGKELTLKQDDFWRLINREQFLLTYFNARLRYRIPARNNECVYVQVNCDDKTIGEHTEQYILSYLQPKHTKPISYPPEYKQILCDDELLNRLMKEYLVHIEVEDKNNSHQLIFRSTTLTVLFLAIDDFRKAISNVHGLDSSLITHDAEGLLRSISTNFENNLTLVDENDQYNDDEEKTLSTMTNQQIKKESEDDNDDDVVQDDNVMPSPTMQGPKLKIAHPGEKSEPYKVSLSEVIIKPKQRKPRHSRPHPHASHKSDLTDNELVHEMRQKLKGRNIRDVIIDGANIGRTYGDSEFSARGIKLAVDLFQAFGYPDSKIVVIVPAHYLSKDKDHVFPDLIRRKIVHKAFQQKIGDQPKRFYDDRLIVDIAVMRKGVILSNDFYRDLLQDSGDSVRKAIRERLLCYRFIGDNLMLPNPVSEGGLPLDVFLSM